MHYLLLAALCPPYCYCYSAASCLPVRLKPYTNWSCLGSCLTFFTGMVAAFGSTQASFFYYTVTFKPPPQGAKQCILRCENTSQSFTSCVMASSHRALKQWCLSKVETNNSFENWKQNLLYSIIGQQLRPFPSRWCSMVKKTKSPTTSTTRNRW